MVKHQGLKFMVAGLCALALTLFALASFVRPSQQKTTTYAVDNLLVNVSLVETYVDYQGGEYSVKVGDTPIKQFDINDNDTVVLDNTEAYNRAVSNESFGSGIKTQAVRIAMGTSDSSTEFALLKTSATLNGQGINTQQVGTDSTFEQFIFGLPNEFYTSDAGTVSTPINESSGQYVFTYTYRTTNTTTGVSSEATGTFRLNVLTAPYLSQTNGENAWDYQNTFTFIEDADPSIANTASATRADENLFFNYNNHTYDSATSALKMPVVKYDASKYNLSYTRKVYNSLETVTSQMAVSVENNVTKAVVTFTSTLNGVSETFDYTIDDLDNAPFVELAFEDIGEYEISMSPLTRAGKLTFLKVSNSDPTKLGAQNIVRNLTVFGYQLKYADNSTDSAELRNANLGLYGDITTLNYNLMASTLTNNVGALKFFTNDDGEIVIPSTNQAPLWFDYIGTLSQDIQSKYVYYSKTSILDFSKLGTVTPTKTGEYKKGEYFMDAGLYLVEINYKLSSISYSNQTFKQYFAFIIANTAPSAEIVALGDNTIVYNDGYTNQDVAINWDDSNPFNAPVTAQYSRYNFQNQLVENNVTINKYGSTNQTVLKNSGKYYVRLSYGRLGTSFTSWEFTIDKVGISGLKINFDELMQISPIDALTTNVVNTPFKLSWDAKASGAQITLEHQKMLLVKDDSYNVNELSNLVYIRDDSNGNKIYALKNGYKTSTISSSVKYDNLTEFEVSQYALHLFKLRDEAGNELYYSILLDNTSASYIFSPKIENNYNIIDETTTAIWGSSKAIRFDAPESGDSVLFDYFVENSLLNSLCDTEKGILNIPFESITIRYASTDSALNLSSHPQVAPAMQVVIDKDAKTISAYASNIDISSGSLSVTNNSRALTTVSSAEYDEYFFKVEVLDKSTLASGLKTSGLSMTKMEVNLDASQVLAFTDDDVSSDIRLYNGSASNRDKLYIDYFAERNNFKVESLTLDFYPFAMDKSLDSYPYTSTSSLQFNLLESATYDSTTGKMKTNYFNVIYDSNLNKEVTQAGKYVVTRVYEYDSALFQSEDDSLRTKTYTFYIDRNDIIENITVDYPLTDDKGNDVFTRTVGEYIKLALGNKNSQYAEFDDLLLSAEGNNVILTTDIFPINAIVPENKYSVLDKADDRNYSTIYSFNTQLKIYYKRSTDDDSKFSLIANVSAYDTQSVAEQLLLVNPEKLQRAGVYKFELNDFTGYSKFVDNVLQENINPNTFTFRIEVNKEAPNGKYYRNPNEDGSENEIIRTTTGSSSSEVASSNDDELKFVFEDSVDIYKANINHTDVLVSRRTKGSTRFETAVTVSFDDATYNEDGEVIYPSSTSITNLAGVKGIREIKKDSNGLDVKDANGNNIYKYTIILPTKNNSGTYYEGEYRVTIHYYGDKKYYDDVVTGVSYYQSEIDVVLDRTAPNFNILRLLAYDKYLPETSTDPNVISKENIAQYVKNELNADNQADLKERVRQFLRNYAFALPSDFVFYQATNDGYPIGYYDDYTYYEHDTSAMYVRKYNKYSTTDPNADQSYIKSDPEFGSTTGVLSFDIGREEYIRDGHKKPTETNLPFYETVKSIGGGADYGNEGYYEIIEIDQAGNQRIYTVYLKRTNTQVEFTNGTDIVTGDAENSSLSLGYDYKISSIASLDCFTRISLYDQTTRSSLIATYDITPTTSIDDVISAINARICNATGYETSGARYTLEFLNRYGDNFSVSVQRPGKELSYTIEEANLTFKITLPTSTSSTWLTKFIVKQYDEKTNSLIELTSDLNGSISDTLFDGVSYTFNRGEYYFYLIDNFGRGQNQPIHYIFNIVDTKDLTFSGTQIENTTANDVYFTYQTKLYTAKIYVDGEQVINLEDYENIISNYNQAYFTEQLTFKAESMKKTTYKIVLSYNTSGVVVETQDIVFDFVIDTILPSFELVDLNGNNMNYLLTNAGASTSKEIVVNWNDPTNYPVTVTLDRVYNGTKTSLTLSKNYNIYLEGQYTLKMTNALGNSVEYSFAISQNSAILYDVYANGEKIDIAVRSALFQLNGVYNDETFDINEYIKIYASIHDLSVVANEKKDLQAKLIYSYTSNGVYKLDLYKIYGTSTLYYSEYIALLKLDRDILTINNFFLGESADVMSDATGVTSTFYSEKVYATWQKSLSINVVGFGDFTFDDFIKVRVYYNSIYVDEFTTNSLTFSDSGEYRLNFIDIAGNSYTFSRGQVESAYYTIDLLNSVSFKVNDGEPIDHAIYNDKVTLQPTNTSRYDKGSFTMTIVYKGTTYPARDFYQKPVYVFSEYGDYVITMSAKINGTDIKSVYNFKIFSANEANRSFVFSQLDGFEVTSIVKSGVDITNELKTEQNTTKIMAFEFSSDEGQVGVYEVNVKVTNSGLKPTQSFTFKFWINDADLNLMPSIPFGTSTTAPIIIKLNKYAIHQELGNIVLKISGMDDILINAETAQYNEVSRIILSKNITYTIQAYTESGTLLQSYVITKNEPLNTVAIIVIIISVIVVVGAVVLFIAFRTRMKVR